MTAVSVGLPPTLVGTGDLFQLMRDGRPRTRGELAQLSSLARSTITARVDALLLSGLLQPVGEAATAAEVKNIQSYHMHGRTRDGKDNFSDIGYHFLRGRGRQRDPTLTVTARRWLQAVLARRQAHRPARSRLLLDEFPRLETGPPRGHRPAGRG